MLLRTRNSDYDQRKAMEGYIREGVELGIKAPWRIVTIEGTGYLARILSYEETILGALISTELLREKLLLLANYDTRDIKIVNSDVDVGSDGWITVSAVSHAGDYKICGSVLESEIYQQLPVIHKLLFCHLHDLLSAHTADCFAAAALALPAFSENTPGHGADTGRRYGVSYSSGAVFL